MIFIEKLIQLVKKKKRVVCMGLDPRLDQEGQISNFLIKEIQEPDKIRLEFNKQLIENYY